MHRDFDDFKFLGLIVYWNKITKRNGALCFQKGSHKEEKNNQKHVYLEGEKGEAFLVDLYGLHSGSKVTDSERYTTFFRFGNKFNYASVVDGNLHNIKDTFL